MPRAHEISLVGLTVAAVTAGLSAHATSAAPLPTKSTIDVTYSCPVQKVKVVNINAATSFKAPPGTTISPGALGFDTGIKKKTTTDGSTTTQSQASVVPKKDGIRIDKQSCTKLKKRIPLSSKGLKIPFHARPHFRGYTSQACDSASKIVFRLQVHLTGGAPTSAVLAVRNADAKAKPIALVNWSPKKISAHFSNGCTSLNY